MKPCELCPRKCRVDRANRLGFCGAAENLRVALVSLHRWEEPCLVGQFGAGRFVVYVVTLILGGIDREVV